MQFSTFRKTTRFLFKNKRIKLFLLHILLVTNFIASQSKTNSYLDSLFNLTPSELQKKYYQTLKLDPVKAYPYAYVYLSKAKKINHQLRISNGYSLMAFAYENDFNLKIKYLDSAIALSKSVDHKYLASRLHIYKGKAYDDNGFFTKALENYVDGLEFSKKYGDRYHEAIISHNIALLKRRIGKYEEAKLLLKTCLEYEESRLNLSKSDTIGYLTTLAELVTTYRRNNEVDSALTYNKIGLEMSKNQPNKSLFILNKGILQFYNRDYENAIKNLENSLSYFLDTKNISYSEYYNLIDNYLFLGKSFLAISKKEEGISYLKKIDSITKKTNFLTSETRPAYEIIINYYKSLDDKNNQLYYINRLLYNDSILDHNYRNVNNKLFKDYDTPILLQQKEKLITDLTLKKNRSNNIVIISFILVIVISSLLLFHYRKNKKYKKRFNELMNSRNTKGVKTIKDSKQIELNISDNIVEIILQDLDKFERNRGFLKPNITSPMIAKQIKTNSKYLTSVIKFYRNKSFTQYINDLRIEYIIKALKKDDKLQKFTIKAIAEEAGFNSPEVFSKSFFKKTGIYPSYFIKQLQSNKN